jgi:hypothetical protein
MVYMFDFYRHQAVFEVLQPLIQLNDALPTVYSRLYTLLVV